MQDLGAEKGQLHGFFITDVVNQFGVGNNTGIRGIYTVNIRPDFQLFRVEAHCHERGGKIGSVTTQQGLFAGHIRTDKAAHEQNSLTRGAEGHECVFYFVKRGVGLTDRTAVGNDVVPAIEHPEIFSGCRKDFRHYWNGQALAHPENPALNGIRTFTERGGCA
ncbi:MAG: hypothetical protein BWY20_02252 [Spirochaetes bacterium ADurb.Bin215]|nr:MAG: hypothetical protein BWY20_02252 [Spirochaetes bacterium ADurb.Bin215]